MRLLALIFTVTVFLAITCNVPAEDTTVALSAAPAAVQKTIQAQISDGAMGDITKSADDEETVYDVDLTAKDGSGCDFSVAEDGTLLSVEVALGETPDAAQKTIQAELSGGTLESIDKNLADSEITYDISGTGKDGREKDFTVADDGTVLNREVALTDTPDAVQKTIAAQLNGGKVESIDENFDDDGTNFDIEVMPSSGPETSFNVTAAGTLASKQVAFADVPPRIRATIKAQIGDGTVLRVDRSFVKEKGILPFDIEGRKGGKPFDFSVGPKGRFLGINN